MPEPVAIEIQRLHGRLDVLDERQEAREALAAQRDTTLVREVQQLRRSLDWLMRWVVVLLAAQVSPEVFKTAIELFTRR